MSGFLLSSLSTSVAGADPPAASAEELGAAARRAHEAGHLDEAIEGYARAYQLSGDLGLLFRLAEAHRDAGHDADALRIYQTYLRRAPTGPHHETAEARVKELELRSRRAFIASGSAAASPSSSAAAKPVGPPAASKPTATAGGPTTASAKPTTVAGPPSVAMAGPSKMTDTPHARAASLAAPPAAPAASPARRAALAGDEPEAGTADGPAVAAAPVAVVVPPAPSPPRAQPSVDLTTNAISTDEGGRRRPPIPRFVPWTLAAATVALGAVAAASGLSASRRYDQLQGSCGQTDAGCTPEDVDVVRSRARRANLLWALTAVAGAGAGITAAINVRAAGVAGLWRF